MFRATNTAAVAAGISLLFGTAAVAAPVFVNGITIGAGTLDLSGDTSGATPTLNQRVGMFSDLYYDPLRKEWWGVGDRGPGGGTLSYDTRVQRFTLDVNPTTGAISSFKVVETVKFTDPSNLLGTGAGTLNGLAPSTTSILGRSFDPEGFVVNPKSGNFLVSDEYGPSIYEFNRKGELVKVYGVPPNLVPKAGANVNYNAPPPPGAGNLTSGREGNRGLEGLAISPDGRYAYAMLQNGTVTDGNVNGNSLDRGMYTRIVKYDTATGAVVAQYAYRLDGNGPAPAQGRGISAIVALDDNRFMVLERNNRGVGVPNANIGSPDKKVYIIDITGATDVTNVNLNGTLPPGTVAVTKATSPLIDLAANTLPDLGNRVPEKWEGLAIGPQLTDGDYLILAGTDNDFSITQNGTGTQFDVYYNPTTGGRIQCDIGTFNNCISIQNNGNLGSAFTGSVGGYELIPGVLHSYKADSLTDLGGYVAPIPEPRTLALLGLGLLGLLAGRRRTVR